MNLNRIWRSLTITLVLVLALSATALFVSAQSEAVISSTVKGTIDEPFGKIYMDMTDLNLSQPVKIEMTIPQAPGAFETNTGFAVFDDNGYAKVLNATSANAIFNNNLSLGTTETVGGVKSKVAVIAPPIPANLHVIVFNDTAMMQSGNLVLDFTLTTSNGKFVDASGEQVMDPSAPVESGDDADADDAEAEDAEADDAASAEATAASTPESTAPVTTTAEVSTDSSATETVAPIAPTVISTTTLIGVLDEAFETHIFQLDVFDPRPRTDANRTPPGVKLELTDVNNTGVQAIVFTTDQFQTWATSLVPPDASKTRGGVDLEKIVLGPERGYPANVDVTEIQQPADMFLVVVYNGRTPGSPYELRVTEMNGVVNGVLYDESAQSTTAQELQPAVAPVAETDEEDDAGTATDATTAPTARTISPGGTYTVRAGDTLGTIALGAYGNSAYYVSIGAANPEITNLNLIEVGQVLNIPSRAEADRLLAAAGTAAEETDDAPAPATTPTPAAAAATPTPTASTGGTRPTATPTTAPGGAAPTATPTAEAGASAGNIIEVATSSRQFEILLLALDLAELTGALNQVGPFTVFAPTDAAFATLPEATLDSLLADPAELARVLQFHVVPGRFTSADLTDGATLTTLLGDALTISVDGSGNILVNGARVVNEDFDASNGVVHGIDAVLLP